MWSKLLRTLLVLAVPIVLALSACSKEGGGPTNPTPTESPKSYLKIIVNLPASGSVVCTNFARREYLTVSLSYNLVEDYPQQEVFFFAALSNDGINPLPEGGEPESGSISCIPKEKCKSGTFDMHWTPKSGVRSSQWLLASYEYRPLGPWNKERAVILATDRKQWTLTFNNNCQ